ncbi:MAG: SagB/ThcOx family dehydrogenase [Acidobacteriia bacterium]|nr:SagB/ThcOx family dehydrogenase [Terriglobia bacterium]
MTRFLPRISDGARAGGFNEDTERLFAYHHATKHTYHSVRSSAHYLDWRNQPDPFRTYEGAPLIVLPLAVSFPNTGTFAAMAALSERADLFVANDPGDPGKITLDMAWLSNFLWHSMALSAWKQAPGGGHRYSLRVNPSSGNLHPTETHLALLGFKGIDDGLYHYRADRHALELRCHGAWTGHLAQSLEIPWAAESPLILALTSIFWREAWKYRDRAYRYCCHDLGHATMSLLLAARALGHYGGAVAHFADLRVTRALGLGAGDESPMVFLIFPPANSDSPKPAPPEKIFAGSPNELSPEEIPYELLLEMHRATILSDPAGPVPAPPTNAATEHQPRLPSPEPARDAPLGEIARRRRSALDFDPRTPPMPREDAEQILDFATRDWPADWRGNFHGALAEFSRGADFIALYLYVHRVRGCESGVYQWDTSARRMVQLHRGSVERVAAFLSLEQPLAGNSCFTVSMIADLAGAARIFSNRGYRYVYFEAGAIGQRLYLGAEALGWNATGIGAFYDDDVHRYLGFLGEEEDGPVSAAADAAERNSLVMLDSPASRHAAAQQQHPGASSPPKSGSGEQAGPRQDPKTLPSQVIYHFAVGRAIPDPRIEG